MTSVDTKYGIEALRRLRKKQRQAEHGAEHPDYEVHAWTYPPSDAPMDDATVTVWHRGRFMAWDKWLATAPIVRDEGRLKAGERRIPAGAMTVAATCGGKRVVLARDSERWLIYTGTVHPGNRRKDFATPFLEHAIRTAEAWYGVPADGWRAETRTDGKRKTAADVPAEHSID